MLTTTLYLDFGEGIGFSQTNVRNVLAATAEELRTIAGAGTGIGTGPDFGFGPEIEIDYRPIDYDYDGNGVKDGADITALATDVLPLVRRQLEPFDITVAPQLVFL